MDDCRRIHLQRCWKANRGVTECERTPRQYTKRNDSYWMEDIKTSWAKRQRICCEQSVDTDENQQPLGIDIESLSADEIKLKLHEFGYTDQIKVFEETKRASEKYHI